MEKIADITEIMKQRENMYRFLSGLYKQEIDEEVFRYMKETEFPEDGDAVIAEGYKQMKSFINSSLLDPVTDLAVDYARVFLGAGIAETDQSAYPYESVYTSEYKLIMQEARDSMFHVLTGKDLGVKKGYDIPEDHIFIQLEFMAFFCKEIVGSVKGNDKDTAELLMSDQREFMKKHMLNWIPTFCEDVRKFALTDFYRGLAKVTNRFISMDMELLEELIASYSD